MALKPYRSNGNDITQMYFMFSTGERGGVVCTVDGNGTGYVYEGAATDDADRRVEYATNASGRQPVGLLLHDVVNIDQSRQDLNKYKSEHQIGDKVPLAVRGEYTTNFIADGQASGIQFPAPAYLGLNGRLYSAAGYNTASGYPQIGRFLTQRDANGYAVVHVDIR